MGLLLSVSSHTLGIKEQLNKEETGFKEFFSSINLLLNKELLLI